MPEDTVIQSKCSAKQRSILYVMDSGHRMLSQHHLCCKNDLNAFIGGSLAHRLDLTHWRWREPFKKEPENWPTVTNSQNCQKNDSFGDDTLLGALLFTFWATFQPRNNEKQQRRCTPCTHPVEFVTCLAWMSRPAECEPVVKLRYFH